MLDGEGVCGFFIRVSTFSIFRFSSSKRGAGTAIGLVDADAVGQRYAPPTEPVQARPHLAAPRWHALPGHPTARRERRARGGDDARPCHRAPESVALVEGR
jgi:hypothetical protein